MINLLIFKTLSFVFDISLLGIILWVFFGIPVTSAFVIAFISVWIYEEIYEYVEFNRYGDLN